MIGGEVKKSSEMSHRRRAGLAALPLIAFFALGLLLFARLGAGDASRLPSALIGHQAPKLELAGLDGGPGLADADLRSGHVRLVNIFASWCQPCHVEHEHLMALAGDAELKAKGVEIFGVAQKDSAREHSPLSQRGGRPLRESRPRPRQPGRD